MRRGQNKALHHEFCFRVLATIGTKSRVSLLLRSGTLQLSKSSSTTLSTHILLPNALHATQLLYMNQSCVACRHRIDRSSCFVRKCLSFRFVILFTFALAIIFPLPHDLVPDQCFKLFLAQCFLVAVEVEKLFWDGLGCWLVLGVMVWFEVGMLQSIFDRDSLHRVEC